MRKAFFILTIILLSVSALFAQNKEILTSDSASIWHKSVNNTFYWANVKITSQLDSLYPKHNFYKLTAKGNKIDTSLINLEIEKSLKYCEENGYPFAEFKFDSIQINNDTKTINASIIFNPNFKVYFDTLKVTGQNVVSIHFLSSYLNLKPGSIYDERKINSIQKKIDELSFVKLNATSQLYFLNGKSVVVLNTMTKNANIFDGLIGLQPNGINGKTAIVGQAQLQLVNVIHRAEKLFFDFRSQANNTRDIKLFFSYPYVFRTSLGVDFNLDIRRQDSSFSNFGRGIGLQYIMSGNNLIRFIYKTDESNLLSTKKYKSNIVLPEVIDVKKNSYGINIQLEKLDYRINPKSGYSLQSTILLTQRTISKNPDIEDSLYRNIDLTNNQVQIQVSAKKYIPVLSNSTILAAISSKWIEGGALFRNELLRFGGINDLRGFDEESIFASLYWQSSIEYRLLFDKNSFIRLFYDQAFYLNGITQVQDYPYGIGLGVQAETSAGMLQVNYALGAQQNAGLNFRTGKIHFGIINYF